MNLGKGHFPPSLSSSEYLERTSLQRPRSESMANCETFPSKQGTQKYDNVRIELKVKLKKLIFSSRKSIYELVEVGNLGEELCKYIR